MIHIGVLTNVRKELKDMKKRKVILAFGMSLALLISGCSGNKTDMNDDKAQNSEKTQNSPEMDQEIFGQVAEVEEDYIIIEKTEQQRGLENPDTESGKTEASVAVGEKQEIKIDAETVIKRGGMGMPGGEALQQPAGGQPQKPDGEMPQQPDGGQPQGNLEGEEPPQKPDGEPQQKADGEMQNQERPDGENEEEIAISNISVGDQVSVILGDDGVADEIRVMQGGAPGQAQEVQNYNAVEEYDEDAEKNGETVASTGADENGVHVLNGAEVSLKDMTVTRKSQDSKGGDQASFYGVGAAVLATEGTAYISKSDIQTESAGGAGIFSYGKGSIYVADTKIDTRKDTSGGIHVAGGGSLFAWNLNVETSGESAAAIRSDRGGGKMVVDGGTYTSSGIGSPAVYSTADIAVNNAKLSATGSEAVCIEGLNSLRLFDCSLKGSMKDDAQNDCTWNVILYQSMSGDSEVGNSTFEMDGGSLAAENGGMFYTTNTESTFILSDVDITYADDSEFFLRCTGNNNQRGWGASGNNGADCSFTGINQEMNGDIIWDSISKLDFYMTDGSTFSGAVVDDETYVKDRGDGYGNLFIGKECTWMVTGDSVLTGLSCEGTIVDEYGKAVTVKGNDGTVYKKGNSQYTVMVDSFDETVDLSGASALDQWSDYEVEKPQQL